MNEYVKYTTSFYVFDLYKYDTSEEFLKSLQLITHEDIIIISLQNVADQNLRETYESIINKQCNQNKEYVFLHLDYKLENDLFLLMIKRGLHTYVEDVYYKIIKISTKNMFGKIYKKVMKYYFIDYIQKVINTNNHSIQIKCNKRMDGNNNVSTYFGNEEKKKEFNITLRKDMLLYQMDHRKYFNYLNKCFQHAKDINLKNDVNIKNKNMNKKFNHSFSHQYNINQYEIFKKKKIQMKGTYSHDNTFNHNFAYHYNSDTILVGDRKERYAINHNICNMKNKKEIYTHNSNNIYDNNNNKKCFNNNNIYDNNNNICDNNNNICDNNKKYDRNILHCITLMINNIRFCICFCNFDIYKYIETKSYYQYIFYKERERKNNFYKDKENNPFYISYMNYHLNLYNIFCKQLYNHFMNKIIFETKKEDMYLFSMDIIIFIGFDKLVLCNINENMKPEKDKSKYNNIKNKYKYLSNNSLYFDKNIIIFNKNTHHFLIQKNYKTLTREKKLNLIPIGMKSVCDLYTLIKINIIDDFFLYHKYNKQEQHYSFINHLKSKIKKNKKKNITISVEPNIINLNVINTYEIYHTSFEICYDYKEIEEHDIYTYEKSHPNKNNAQLISSTFFFNNNHNTLLCDKKYYEEEKEERYSSDGKDNVCCVIFGGNKKDKKFDEGENKTFDAGENKTFDAGENKTFDVPHDYKIISDPIGEHINDDIIKNNKNHLKNISSNYLTKQGKKYNYLFHLLHMSTRKKKVGGKKKKKKKKYMGQIS
ncbi:hypothetical protein PFNF135_04663 [Plasmodium falciparum NF135/5.C10]|uniref:Uncharacterized protein n=1 Tax=Plasmodium falciparum NF135/5.C10 TaxID=1036726 RepID=W4IBE3_PLAFA|nr:hypothetical protein PFNF135_04663 [Plasmodium falciparum NF135/5.C10]